VMEEMEWFSRAMFGVLAANNLGFGATPCSGWIRPNFWSAAQPQGHEISKIRQTENREVCNKNYCCTSIVSIPVPTMCQSTKVGRKNKKKLVQDGFFTKTFTV
jgi:hypothetical protein